MSELLTKETTEQRVYAFACRTSWAPQWGETIYNTTSAGKAKLAHFQHVHDAWDSVKFTDIRARKIGPAHSSDEFKRNAHYRGMPDVRCGDSVKVSGCAGTIVGHNSSANFDVLFHDGKYAGQTLNVHPSELVR